MSEPAAEHRDEWPFAHGGPPLQGVLRASDEDFRVDEQLGIVPDGSGEHVFLRVEKRGANTDFIARELARFAGVGPNAVSYAGLKDRHAVARQTFSVHLPGKPDPDWTALARADMQVLEAVRHSRKLQRGALRANRFRIVLREVVGDRASAERVIAAIQAQGVPNYFGEQRFGRTGDNVERALAMFAGRRVRRHERSLLLSAARSHLFNRVLAMRVARGDWNRSLSGEVWMLAGSHSIFGPEPDTPELRDRLACGDIAPTGPLHGAGASRCEADALAIEQCVLQQHAALCAGLEAAGLQQQRRALVLRIADMRVHWSQPDALELAFELPAGCYATVVLRELCGTREPRRAGAI